MRRFGLLTLIALGVLVPTPRLRADIIAPIGQTTIIDNPPIGKIGGGIFGSPGFAVNRGDGISSGFIDAAMLLYDFGKTTSVTSAVLTLNVDTIFSEVGVDPTILMYAYGDSDAVIQLIDITLGAGNVRDSFTYSAPQVRAIDVTAAVNDALAVSQFVGFRFENSRLPFFLPDALEGIHYVNGPPLEFTAGPPTAAATPVPEPTSLLLFGLGGLGVVGYRWARRGRAG